MPAPAEHRPLDRERHAAVIEFITRNNPRAWRVLFQQSVYIYDDRDHLRSVTIEIQASELRVRFQSETNWNAAIEILRKLIRLDREACRMSIGAMIDGKPLYGEYVGADAL